MFSQMFPNWQSFTDDEIAESFNDMGVYMIDGKYIDIYTPLSHFTSDVQKEIRKCRKLHRAKAK